MTKAVSTRLTILQKALTLIYRQGYGMTSIDTILATTQLTKGAFFYHFRNKEEMGLALIQELIKPAMEEAFVKPLAKSSQPTQAIYTMMKQLLLKDPFFEVQYGCPAVNLASELSAANEPLHQALLEVMRQCQQAVQSSIERGQATGQIRPELQADQAADFILVGYSGIRNLGKLFGRSCYQTYLRELKRYLQTLT
ncbi:MAG: TetR family transcriptional regulator [Spirosoma sp.]|nr:TetR family transcriptional regulator [Spirosoma sp.]